MQLTLQTNLFNRNFHLKLAKDTSAFKSNINIEDDHNTALEHDLGHLYSGSIYGQWFKLDRLKEIVDELMRYIY